MALIPWLGRLQTVGATKQEIAAVQDSYYAATSDIQAALNTLIAGIDNAGLLVMLTTWRTSGAPFHAGYPAGGLPFGSGVPVLTGNPADDTSAISAGTGVPIPPGVGTLTSFQGRATPAAVLTKADVTGTGVAAADVGALSSFQGRATAAAALTKADVTGTGLAAADLSALTSFQGRGTAAAVLTKADVTGTGVAAADVAAAQALTPTAVKTSGYTAAAGDFVPVDSTGGTVAITLPTAPADKTRIGVKIIAQAATPNNVTITVGGSDRFNKAGGSTTMTLAPAFQGVLLQYAASSALWYVTALEAPLGTASGAARLGSDNTIGGAGGSAISTAAVVSSFQTRAGAVTLTKSDVTGTGLAAADVGALASGARWISVINATNASWPIPAGTVNIKASLIGGGGQGGGGGTNAGANTQSGGAGGGNGAVVDAVFAVGANTTLNLTVGAGGSAAGGGGASGGNVGTNGSAGASTSLAGTGISYAAPGGSGGSGAAASNASTVNGGIAGGALANAHGTGTNNQGAPLGQGGEGGAGSLGATGGGPVSYSGGGGGGTGLASSTLGGIGGSGGTSSAGGAAGTGNTGTAAGGNGTAAAANTGAGGGGGGGAPSGGAGGNGGNGGSGYIVLEGF